MTLRTFNTLEKDKYPTFSLCLTVEESEEQWRNPEIIKNFYQTDRINETLYISMFEYYEMLQGDSHGKTNFSLLEFDQAKRNILTSVFYESTNLSDRTLQGWYFDEANESSLLFAPFHVEYQEPHMLCITRNDTFLIKQTMATEDFVLNFTNWLGSLIVYVHYPGQLMAEIDGRKKKWFQVSSWDDIPDVPQFDIDIFQMNVLRRRHDSETGCNPDVHSNLDIRWRESIIKNVKCIPTYWKNLVQSTELIQQKFKDCTRSDQYREFFDKLAYGQGWVKYEPSCISTTMTKFIRKGDFVFPNRSLSIRFNHQSKEYIEIINSRATTFEELFGQIGGWIGIILAYSLLQIPRFLFRRFDAMRRCLK